MEDHHQDLVDLISLVEEYKQHAVHAEAELKNHKAHIEEQDREINRLRQKTTSHNTFVRELEESVRSLDRQLKHQSIAQSRKDEEIRSLKKQILSMDNAMTHHVGAESQELDRLREEKKRLNIEIALKDQQLHEFERQIDYQQTKIMNMKAGVYDHEEKSNSNAYSSSRRRPKEKEMQQQEPNDGAVVSQESIGLSLYSIGEESPIRQSQQSSNPSSPTTTGNMSTETSLKIATSEIGDVSETKAAAVESPPGKLSSRTLSSGSSPRSGKVETITDASEFGSSLDMGSVTTIFGGMLRGTTVTSPQRTTGDNKWASPRDDSPPSTRPVDAVASPATSPAKPPKPSKKKAPPPVADTAPSSAVEMASSSRAHDAAAKEYEAKTLADATMTASKLRRNPASSSTRAVTTGSFRQQDVTLDSGTGIHHALGMAQHEIAVKSRQQRDESGNGFSSRSVIGKAIPLERTSVESAHTPDTLSPPQSPEHRQESQRHLDSSDSDEDDDEAGVSYERRQPRATSERRIKTLASIQAIVNSSRRNRGGGIAGGTSSNSSVPDDMEFEQVREESRQETVLGAMEHIRRSREQQRSAV
jgi:hypothetical protein